MGFIVKKIAEYSLAPAGTFVARCVQLIDLGTQYSEFYDKWTPKILVGWELPTEIDEKREDKRPFLVWHRYTLSLHDNATLRAHLESWRGRAMTKEEIDGFDISKIVGVPCMLSIIHASTDSGDFANVSAVMAIPRSVTVPNQIHDSVVFDIDNWDDDVFSTFSENLQKTILKAKECQTKEQPQPSPVRPEDHLPPHEQNVNEDIPF